MGLSPVLNIPLLPNLRQWSDKHAKDFCIVFFPLSLPPIQPLLQFRAELKDRREKEESSSFSLGQYNLFHPWNRERLS